MHIRRMTVVKRASCEYDTPFEELICTIISDLWNLLIYDPISKAMAKFLG